MSEIFFFQAEDGIRDLTVTGVQTCALPISLLQRERSSAPAEAGRAQHQGRDDQFGLRNLRHGVSRLRDPDRKSVVEGKSVDLGGRRIIKKKKRSRMLERCCLQLYDDSATLV